MQFRGFDAFYAHFKANSTPGEGVIEIDDHALFPSICFCDPWNNNIHYGKVTGSSC